MQIPLTQRDPDLLDKLRAELSGILAWAIQGCIEHQRHGLATPAQVRQATAEYRSEMDVIGEFLSDCCLDDAASECAAKDLYQAYRAWCEEAGKPAVVAARIRIELDRTRPQQRSKAPRRHLYRDEATSVNVVKLESRFPNDRI